MNLTISPVNFRARIILEPQQLAKSSEYLKKETPHKTSFRSKLYKKILKKFLYPKISVKLKMPS